MLLWLDDLFMYDRPEREHPAQKESKLYISAIQLVSVLWDVPRHILKLLPEKFKLIFAVN